MPTYFLSDLHVFSRRSKDKLYVRQLEAAASRAKRLILGGDIFDFRWSTLASFEDSLDAAEAWLRQLVGPRPDCEFHYILGNHDCHPHFVRRLEQLRRGWTNFYWHTEYLRINNDVFLHGDVLDGPATSSGLAERRARWGREMPRGRVQNSLYDAAVAVRAHKAVATFLHPHQRVARRLLKYLDHIGHGSDSGLQRVFFGHTHNAVEDFLYENIEFHNGGAPIPGLKFRVVEVTRPDMALVGELPPTNAAAAAPAAPQCAPAELPR